MENLSQPYNVALASTGADGFVVVDGAADGGAASDIYRVDQGASERVARFDSPLISPKAWRGHDGEVEIVGMQCGEVTDGANDCPRAPLRVVTLRADDTTEVGKLDVTTAGSVGFAAGPMGGDGIALVTLDGSLKAHVYTVDKPGGRVADRGAVDLKYPAASRLCSSGDSTFIVPGGGAGSSGSAPVYQITSTGVHQAGALGTVAGDQPMTASGCSADGTALTSILEGQKIVRSLVPLAHPDKAEQLSFSSPYDSGQVSLTDDGRLLAWTRPDARTSMDGQDSWLLSERSGGSWQALGRVSSSEPPRQTVAGPNAAAVVVAKGRTTAVAVIR